MIIKCPECGKEFDLSNTDSTKLLDIVRNSQFKSEVEARVSEQLDKKLSEKELEIKELKHNHELLLRDKLSQFREETAEKTDEIKNLKAQIKQLKAEHKVDTQTQLNNKELEYNKEKQKLEGQITYLEDKLEAEKNYKLMMSTKDIGEDLEKYCKTEFEKVRSMAFRDAVFEKDNTAVSGGKSKKATKGDFIFKDYIDGVEYISIMFDMKNERDVSKNKSKNESHFSKLNEDRLKKNCEYAILVSTLEKDNELYNNGIYEVPNYDKMYVIRPQMFIPMISLLRNANRKSVSLQRDLMIREQNELDVHNFEQNVTNIVSMAKNFYDNAKNKHDDAINQIDNMIKQLTNVRNLLSGSTTDIKQMIDNFEDLQDIKKLTYNAPSIEKKFNNCEGV